MCIVGNRGFFSSEETIIARKSYEGDYVQGNCE